jgi:sugar phosphate permease
MMLLVPNLQGLTWPAMYAMVGHWIPAIERSRFMSSFQGKDKPEIYKVTLFCCRVHEHVQLVLHSTSMILTCALLISLT